MTPEDQIVHFVWIGKSLPVMGQLSIKLFQRHGKIPYLWSYDEIENVPDGVVRRDASEILPRDSIFTFQGSQPGLENDGKGSVSHWSDQFQLTLLQKYGGWYSQLDVACLKLPARCDYYFARHHEPPIINTYIMRVPKNAPLLDACLAELRAKINKSTSTSFHWFDSMRIIGSHVHTELPQFISRNTHECGCPTFTDTAKKLKRRIEFLHWCNALCVTVRNGPGRPDSLYYKLLKQENLL